MKEKNDNSNPASGCLKVGITLWAVVGGILAVGQCIGVKNERKELNRAEVQELSNGKLEKIGEISSEPIPSSRDFYLDGVNYRVDGKTLISDLGYCLERIPGGIREFSQSVPSWRDLRLVVGETQIYSETHDSSLNYKPEIFTKGSDDFDKLRTEYDRGLSLLFRARISDE